ncbi:hypothetical protein SDC9_204170 [bioreactor metagenome]|uniref:Uncharacterized protein n=1 Tax=bioreactor metagenome TaxID=1076179 RepID=A0A645IZY8_9ZZZZ
MAIQVIGLLEVVDVKDEESEAVIRGTGKFLHSPTLSGRLRQKAGHLIGLGQP